MVEGFKNGMTNLVVSDKNSRYRRVCVSVYTTDVMTISKESFEMLTPLGQEGRERLEVKGNGGLTDEVDSVRRFGGGEERRDRERGRGGEREDTAGGRVCINKK